ncbi:hypothetical protein M9H77_05207 [Catharanthus roseus]|uniref:Uncharacterized protein n=1 Tax=Catharanthus roseus TaxID=4058 RepID=A0ACC0CGH3_CATRO|nr:hypothetical protein M9H77_05207 [Catharanthus roseus]
MEAGKSVKETSPSDSQTGSERRSLRRLEPSSQTPPPTPHVILPPSRPSLRQSGSPSRGSLGGLGRTPPHDMHTITVGSSGGSGNAIGSVGGIILDGASPKRVREVNESLIVGGDERGDHGQFKCNLCNKEFGSNKKFFGHMRTHTDRNWKGAFPPPTFSRQEFTDTGLLNPEKGEEDQGEQEAEHIVQPQTLEDTGQYRVPDLNLPPSEEDSGSGNQNDN